MDFPSLILCELCHTEITTFWENLIFLLRGWFVMISHLSCLSFKISHNFTGIITLIYFREWKPKLHADRSDQKPLFHWLGLSVLAEGRVSATSPVGSWSIAGRFCSPSTQATHLLLGKKEASTINSRVSCVLFSTSYRKKQNKTKPTKITFPPKRPPKQLEKRRINTI